jgi:hypothetical protein
VILGIAVLLYLANINFNKYSVLTILFLGNFGLGSIQAFKVNQRYGIDYIAYLQQSYAVWMGETDYTKLSSNLGACYYPAGHIWNYFPAVWLHLKTEKAT